MKLADYLPYRLRKNQMLEFQEAVQPEIDLLTEYVTGLPEEFSVNTASGWMGLYEWKYGLISQPEREMDERRARVLAKMRGAGTTTLERTRQVCAPYSEEPPEVIEDNPDYTFFIYLHNPSGKPPENLKDLRAVIEEIKPAHLDYQLVMKLDLHIWYAAAMGRGYSSHTLPALSPPWDGNFEEALAVRSGGAYSSLTLPEITERS